MQLKSGTLLQGGKYKIVRTLGQGGFGITYLAEQPMLERRVCIKEFFFKEYCEREEATSHVTITTKSNFELVERLKAIREELVSMRDALNAFSYEQVDTLKENLQAD